MRGRAIKTSFSCYRKILIDKFHFIYIFIYSKKRDVSNVLEDKKKNRFHVALTVAAQRYVE